MPKMFNLRCELQGHSKDVRCLTEAYVPERAIVSGSRDFTTKIWSENQDHKYSERHCLKGHSNFVGAVASMMPSEQYHLGLLFTASNDKTIRAYASDPPEFIFALDGHSEAVCSLAVDNRRHLLISGSFDKTARVWSGKECLCILSGHEHTIWAVVVLPEESDDDGSNYQSKLPLILTGSADKLIKLWKQGKPIKTFSGHTDCVRSLVALSQFEFLSSSNDCSLKRWNILTGECTMTYSGHENFIYSISYQSSFHYFVSGSEDKTMRIWDTNAGSCLQTIILPAQSVWAVLVLSNGDVACGGSDGVVRIFTADEKRFANADALEAFNQQVAAYGNVHSSADELGGIKIADLPGKEALHQVGNKEGQTKMVRVGKNVEVYSWSEQKYTWEKVGDVLSAKEPSEGKKMYMGKEYDYVFDVDVEEGKPALKLPYNRDEDPWHAAQTFIHDNLLPQVYLNEIVEFIRNNAPDAGQGAPSDPGYADPFTGTGRYVPNANQSSALGSDVVDPFTGAGRYVPGGQPSGASNGTGNDPFTGTGRYVPAGNPSWADRTKIDPKRPRGEHMPLTDYILFTMTANAMLSKLKESNAYVAAELKLSDEQLNEIESLIATKTLRSKESLKTLDTLLKWPKDHLVPAYDVFRLSLLTEFVADHYFRPMTNGLDLADRFCRLIGDKSAPFQYKILVCRSFANSFAFQYGRQCSMSCAVELTRLIVETCVCSERSAVQTSAAATLANFSLCFMQNPDPSKKMAYAKTFFESLKLVEQLGFSLLEQQCLFYLLQALVTLLWGDDEIIKLSKSYPVAAHVNKIKDASSEESSKNIARSIERMLD